MHTDSEINNISEAVTFDDKSSQSVLPVNCLHCGQFLISESNRRSGFCCNGCSTAYKFISKLGLDYFYCLREKDTNWQALPAPDLTSNFRYFDDEKFIKEYVSFDDSLGLSILDLQLRGMHCSACVWVIEKLKDILPGLADIRVNMISGKTRLKFDLNLVKPSTLAATISGMGYQVYPISIQYKKDSFFSVQNGDQAIATRLGVAAFSSMNVMLLFIAKYQGLFSGIEKQYTSFFAWVSMILAIPAVFYSARPFFQTSLSALKFGRLHIDLPISIAIAGGFIGSAINTVIGRPEIYFDTVTALIFLLLCGRWCQSKAMGYASDLSDMIYSFIPLNAKILNKDGDIEEIFSESIKPGDEVWIPTGNTLPCDGKVNRGDSYINNSVITGESQPQEVGPGAKVWAGALNSGSDIFVTATASPRQSKMGKLLSNIQNFPIQESKTSRFVNRISIYFVYVVLVIGLLTFFLSLSNGFWHAWDKLIAFLVVTCPCALGIATPITLSLANAYAAKRGILFRTPHALEALSEVKEFIFDKTGTLTNGNLTLTGALTIDDKEISSHIWDVIYTLEKDSRQPAGQALLAAARSAGAKLAEIKDVTHLSGRGVFGKNSLVYRVGSLKWLADEGIEMSKTFLAKAETVFYSGHTLVGLAADNELMAIFAFGDTIRKETGNAINSLRALGMECKILSGDNQTAVQHVADQLNMRLEGKCFDLLPEEKASQVLAKKSKAAFVGDGINDAPAIKSAEVGIAIHGGAEISMKCADIFLTNNDLGLVVDAYNGARKTLKLIHRHLGISLIYNITAGTLAILGLVGPLVAALVMPASSLTVIISSLISVPFKGVRK